MRQSATKKRRLSRDHTALANSPKAPRHEIHQAILKTRKTRLHQRFHTEAEKQEHENLDSLMYRAQPKLDSLESLKANSALKGYNMTDDPSVVFTVCKLLESGESAVLRQQEANLKRARDEYGQRLGSGVSYRHRLALRSASDQLLKELSDSLRKIEQLNLQPRQQIEYKQQILTAYFDVVLRDCERECAERGLLLKSIWQWTVELLSNLMGLLSKHIRSSESQNLTEVTSVHCDYQQLLQASGQENKRLKEVLESKQNFINNLVYNMRHKRKELKKVYTGVRHLTERANQYRKSLMDLEIQHVELQMHMKDISRETAEFLMARRLKLVKERRRTVRFLPNRKTIMQNTQKQLEAERANNQRVAAEMEGVYNGMKSQRGDRFIFNDVELDDQHRFFRNNLTLERQDIIDLGDYGFEDKATSTSNVVEVGCSKHTQMTRHENLIDGIIKDCWVQTPFRFKQIEMYDRATDCVRMFSRLSRSGLILNIKVHPTETEGRQSSKASSRRKEPYVGYLKGEHGTSKSRFSETVKKQSSHCNISDFMKSKDSKESINITGDTSVSKDRKSGSSLHSFRANCDNSIERMETKASEALQQISEDQQLMDLTNPDMVLKTSNPSPSKGLATKNFDSKEAQSKQRKSRSPSQGKLMKKRYNSQFGGSRFSRFSAMGEQKRSDLQETDPSKEQQMSMAATAVFVPCTFASVLLKVSQLVTQQVSQPKKQGHRNSMPYVSRRLYSLYYSLYEASKKNPRQTFLEMLHQKCNEASIDINYLLVQIRNTTPVTFDTFLLLMSDTESGKQTSLSNEADAKLYLSLLFELNCSNDHILSKCFTTIQRISASLESILRQYVSESFTKTLITELMQLIEKNRDQNGLESPSSLRLDLEKAVLWMLTRLQDQKQRYYDDLLPFAECCRDSSDQKPSPQSMMVSSELLTLLAYEFSEENPAFKQPLLGAALSSDKTLKRYSALALRFGFPLLVNKTSQVSVGSLQASTYTQLSVTSPTLRSIELWLELLSNRLPQGYLDWAHEVKQRWAFDLFCEQICEQTLGPDLWTFSTQMSFLDNSSIPKPIIDQT